MKQNNDKKKVEEEYAKELNDMVSKKFYSVNDILKLGDDVNELSKAKDEKIKLIEKRLKREDKLKNLGI